MARNTSYMGSIDLISGVRPKNGGAFPLIDAADVQTREDGTRLDGELKRMDDCHAEIFGMGDGILSRNYRVTFNAVWNSKKNQASESASLAEICFYDAGGDVCTIEAIAADSTYAADYAAEKTIDGNLSTFWSSANDATVQHWLEITFQSVVSPAQMGVCLRADYGYGLIDEMTVEAMAEDGTWVEVAHVTDAKSGWNGQTERRFDLKYRLQSIEEKYGRTVAVAADALARETRTGTRLIISDAIAGRVMRCECNSPVTVRSRNRVVLGDISFTGEYKLVKFSAPIPAGTYRFSARTESTDTDADVSLIAIGGNYVRIAHDGQRHSATVTASAEFNQMYLYSSTNAAQGSGDTAYWRDIMITDGTEDYPYEPGRDTAVYENPAEVMLNEITNIVEAEADIDLTYAKRNEWLDAILSATKSAELNAQTLGYVTPEMFGAVGDGVTDDLAAMQAALTCAQELGLPVMANRSYLVSGSIVIGSGMDIQMNNVICTATEAAVKIAGGDSRVHVRSITASGVGVALMGETASVLNNRITLGKVKSGGHCIMLRATSKAVSGNSIEFRQLYAGGDGCSCISTGAIDEAQGSYNTENTFTGGQCTHADWAYYGGGGNNKLYNFQVENGIKGGYCFLNGANALICGDRHAESMRDGEFPFIKILSDKIPNVSSGGSVTALKYISSINLRVNEIDVTEVSTQSVNDEGYITMAGSFGSLGRIDCRISAYVETGTDNAKIYQTFAESALIWRNCLIFQGVPEKYMQITGSLDLRTITADTPAMPTVFDIACANAEIHLHPTYCFMGVSKFEVIQTEVYTATIYDYYTGGVIFDGASLGAGEFEVRTFLNKNFARIDGEGMAWRVRRLDGTGSVPVVPDTPAEAVALTVAGDGSATLSGATITVVGDGNATISGATLTVDSSGNATIA